MLHRKHPNYHPTPVPNNPNRGLSCGCWIITLVVLAIFVGMIAITPMIHSIH